MSIDKTLEIASHKPGDTYQIGKSIGAQLRGGEVLELVSDVGGGKTAFVRGLAAGLNSPDQVASPTFTVSRHYRSAEKELEIRHFDFYRLSEPGLMKAELAESIGLPSTVTVIEWGDSVKEVLPRDSIQIEIVPTGEESRLFKLKAPEEYEYLFRGMTKT